jgi:hypothetical protein
VLHVDVQQTQQSAVAGCMTEQTQWAEHALWHDRAMACILPLKRAKAKGESSSRSRCRLLLNAEAGKEIVTHDGCATPTAPNPMSSMLVESR